MSKKMYRVEEQPDHVAVRLRKEIDTLVSLRDQFENNDRTHTLSKKSRLEALPKIRADIETKRNELARHLATQATTPEE